MKKASDKGISTEELDNPKMKATVYQWIGGAGRLNRQIWSYDEFLHEKAHLWIGNSNNDIEYLEVDRRRQMGGKIVN